MVDIVAFDKTGTLTSDKFVFEGIVDSCESYQNLKKI
jgi:magnesium-transporting ATPase (P-type)